MIEEENGMRRIQIGGRTVVAQCFRAWGGIWIEPGARSRQLAIRGMIRHDALSPRGGHASGASRSALRAALPSPPRNHPSGIGLQDGSYVLKNGRVFPSVNTLPPAERAAFLKKHDPCSQLKLNDDSVFFRVTERQWVQDGTPERASPVGRQDQEPFRYCREPVHARIIQAC
ncbi:hypothetical protein GO496_05420 [Acidovorax citrulli]|nr:hypothetical protein [Paracidovorax citrulli]